MKAFSEKGGIYMFVRAQLSAQLATIVDFAITLFLAQILDLFYVYATATGAVCGGLVNCLVNYRWTFKVQSAHKRLILFKYIFVWAGSIILNTYGTFFMTEWLTRQPCIIELLRGYTDNLFIVSKIVVAVLVAVGWNYTLQKGFVFKELKFWHRNSVKK